MLLQTIETALADWRSGPQIARLAELRVLLDDDSTEVELRRRVDALQPAAGEARRVAQSLSELDRRILRDEAEFNSLDEARLLWQSEGQSALEEVKRQLADKEYAVAEQAALEEARGRLAAVGYDDARRNAARARMDELADAPRQSQHLQQAEAAVKPLTDALADLDGQRERIVARVADLRTRCEQATRLLQGLEAGLGDLHALEAAVQRLRDEAITANRAVGGARQQVETLAVRRADRKSLTAARSAIVQRVGLLRQLEEACGRRGVQALLIEQALPELEEYANELLDHLTGGDMRIFFDTQRSSKSKQDSVIETLDIRISDSTGERPYENYSGGEKFRVNFAIRLALSQLLARRAGARLRTLVIDEGFGSQDPEGRQRLVEAINAVQEQFACILVITHIDELRDKFPARIDVEKTAGGSKLAVVTL
jgi:exonuclease SbcC